MKNYQLNLANMARTLTEILQALRADFVANITLVSIYGLDTSLTFEDQFSKVSFEAILTYLVASAIFLYETIVSAKSDEIESKIATEYPFSIPWYSNIALSFQLGDYLVFDENTYKFAYPVIDPEKQIIKYTTIRQRQIGGVTKLQVFATKANKAALTADELLAFSAYIFRAGAGGTHFDYISLAPDQLVINLTVYYNPQILNSTGAKLSDGTKPVEIAINDYLNGIKYGGTYNRTKQTDYVQLAEGVNDVVLGDVSVNGDLNNAQTFESASGFYQAQSIIVNYIVNYEG